MTLDEETLRRVADDGEMNYEKWPGLVEPLLERIDHIVYTEFPIPRPFPIIHRNRNTVSPQLHSRAQAESTPTHPHTANGPIVPSTPTPTRNLPPVPLFPTSSTSNTPSTSQIPDSVPPTQSESQPDTHFDLPAPLMQLLNGIIKTIRSTFTTFPPHTIQRLAELILHPTTHYRTLPAWLRAVDRVVSVTSGAHIFPLPKAMPLPSHVIDSSLLANGIHSGAEHGSSVGVAGEGGGILWLNDPERRNGFDSNGLGSDESLGGALLTPIPWLKNGIIPITTSEASTDLVREGDGDADDLLGGPIELPPTSSDPLVPEREDGAVTQGELIRQEQEAGVVTVGHGPVDANEFADVGLMQVDDDEDEEDYDSDGDGEEERPHARGPGTVGMVDVGMIDGAAVEMNINPRSVRGGARRGPNAAAKGVEKGVRNAQEVLSGGVGSTGISASGADPATNPTLGAVDEMQVDDQAEGADEDQASEGVAPASAASNITLTRYAAASKPEPESESEPEPKPGRVSGRRSGAGRRRRRRG